MLLQTIPKHDYIVKIVRILSHKILNPKYQNPKNLSNNELSLLSVASKNPNIILNTKDPKPAKKNSNTILNKNSKL
jgi:hypothetical protein